MKQPDEIIWHLKNFNIFEAISEEEMDRLQQMISTDWIKHRDPVFLSGEPNRWVYFLKQGLVKLSMTSEEGRTITVALLKPGEIFGELANLDEGDNPLEAIALESSYLCRIRGDLFTQYVQEHPSLALSVNKLLGLRMRRVQTAIRDMVFLSSEARLAKLLHELAESDAEDVAEGKRIILKLTHQEIANLIGASRENVTSLLSRLAAEGLIMQQKRKLIVRDLPALKKRFS